MFNSSKSSYNSGIYNSKYNCTKLSYIIIEQKLSLFDSNISFLFLILDSIIYYFEVNSGSTAARSVQHRESHSFHASEKGRLDTDVIHINFYKFLSDRSKS